MGERRDCRRGAGAKGLGLFLLPILVALTVLGACNGDKEQMYGEEQMRTPFWRGNTMYNEPMLPVSSDGQAAEGQLAFEPAGKVRVTSPTMETTYEEGRDYVIEGRTLRRTDGSAMPYLDETVLYGIGMPEGKGLSTQPVSAAGREKGYESVLYTESPFLIEHQVLVTYTFERGALEGLPVPEMQADSLPATIARLEGKQPLDIVVFGDSVFTGCNSTGGGLQSAYDDTSPGNAIYIPFDRPPYTPTFPELFASGLSARFGSGVSVLGAGMGGQTSEWGAANAARRVVNPDLGYDPDLVLIGFGMNDGTLKLSAERYRENVQRMIDDIREASGKTVEFLLVGTMMANPDAVQCGGQEQYWPELQAVARENEGVAAVDVGGMHRFFLQRKRYADMTANNINHPNDFVIRLYAMNLLGTLTND